MMHQYLSRLQATIDSRDDVEVEKLDIEQPSAFDGRLAGKLSFFNGSFLEFREEAVAFGRKIRKIAYSYHYQRADGSLVFRYDNAPHYPELPGFPCHKHVGEQVLPADPADLREVLQEIDDILYGQE